MQEFELLLWPQTDQQANGHEEKTSPFSGLLASPGPTAAGLAEATITQHHGQGGSDPRMHFSQLWRLEGWDHQGASAVGFLPRATSGLCPSMAEKARSCFSSCFYKEAPLSEPKSNPSYLPKTPPSQFHHTGWGGKVSTYEFGQGHIQPIVNDRTRGKHWLKSPHQQQSRAM